MLKKAILPFLLAVPLLVDASTLYRCTDEFGRTTYTNYKTGARKCTVLSHDDTPRSASSTTADSGKIANASASATPADFPKVNGEMQKSRDGDRRYILEQEVDSEKKHLEDARKSLADQLAAKPSGGGPERLQPTRDRIALHERNLDALKREISSLK
jgi:Domain of unknown function (DUF4124)